MAEYNFSKEFPLPFETQITYIWDANRVTPLQWMDCDLNQGFMHKIVDKLNGKQVNFKGSFAIGPSIKSETELSSFKKAFSDMDKADGSNPFIYFWQDGEENPKCILLVRCWGHLTGCGGLNYEHSIAAGIQDRFLEWVNETLNQKFDNIEEEIDLSYDEKIVEEQVEISKEECLDFIKNANEYLNFSEAINSDSLWTTYDGDDFEDCKDIFHKPKNKKPKRESNDKWYVRFLNKKH